MYLEKEIQLIFYMKREIKLVSHYLLNKLGYHKPDQWLELMKCARHGEKMLSIQEELYLQAL